MLTATFKAALASFTVTATTWLSSRAPLPL
jgi:hypothetical protein